MVDDATCYTAMNGETFAEEQICAGGDPGEHSTISAGNSFIWILAGKDGCQGDSGGPLLFDNDGRWELAGVSKSVLRKYIL